MTLSNNKRISNWKNSNFGKASIKAANAYYKRTQQYYKPVVKRKPKPKSFWRWLLF